MNPAQSEQPDAFDADYLNKILEGFDDWTAYARAILDNPADPRNAFILDDIADNHEKHGRILRCALASPVGSLEKAEVIARLQRAVEELKELF